MRQAVRVSTSLCLMGVELALAGCANTTSKQRAATDDKLIARAMASAAADAEAGGLAQQSLSFHERLYRKNPDDPELIVAYAKALRQVGRLDDARLVVQAPAQARRAPVTVMTEYAMVLVAEGQYPKALEAAQRAVERDKRNPYALHALALAMAGLGQYDGASLQFQEALRRWPEGANRTPIINNLAMSLAAQGKITEARAVMALATGEALDSEIYKHNRALLQRLDDRAVKATRIGAGAHKPLRMKPILEDMPARKPASVASDRMQPIIE